MLFAKDEQKGYYYNKLASSPPGSATRQMLTMVRLLDYTVEQLVMDEAPYNLPVEDRPPPVAFLIPLDLVLDNGDLVASVSTENIEVQNNYYTLTRFYMMPNFGSVSAEESKSGYMFVPDGSGALFALNSFDPGYNGYERPLYWNTVFKDKENMPQFPEDLKIPVYGMMYGETGGFMAIIEKGDETAFIGAKAASAITGTLGDPYNSVYSGFDLTQYKQISIAGASTNGGSYVVGTGMLGMDFVVRYKLFGKALSYFDMAQIYRQFLVDKYGLKINYNVSPRIYMDVTGALNIEGRILGKSYVRTISMTEYSALAEILYDLKDIPLIVSYTGVFNGGIDNKLSNRAVLVPQNGQPEALYRVLKFAEDSGTEFYAGTNIARIYKPKGNGFNARIHASRGYDGEPAVFWDYDPPTKIHKLLGSRYTQLNPLYLLDVLDGFLTGIRRFDKIFVNDLASDYYASYKRRAVVPPLAARNIVDRALGHLNEEKTLALNNPSIDKIPYAAWAVNISRESSNYGGFYASIPFRQLVMNGFVRYTTLDANISGENIDYYLLQALELGSVPKFRITAKNADELKYTEHTEFISTQYEVHKNNIKDLYRRWADAYKKINSAEIINHETLADRVFRTSYHNGVTVTVNYNRYTVESEQEKIPPLAYIIRENPK
jgi:hypothetical protein